MRLTVVHNPDSGDAGLSGPALRSMLVAAGYQVRYVSAKGAWKKALQAPTDLVVAAGGDGTVRDVALAVAGSGVPFSVLPLGTANNIAKTVGIVGPTDRFVRGWRRGRPRPFDIGVASAAHEDARFVESFGGGLFARLIAEGRSAAEAGGAHVGRETDRALSLLRGLLGRARPARWEIELDGRDLSGSYIAVEALNIRFGGPNVPLAPAAEVDDGLLDLVVIRARERGRLERYLSQRLELGAAPLPDLRVARGRRLVVVPPAGVELHLDDEPWVVGGAGDRHRGARSIDVLVRPAAAAIVTGG